MSDFDSPPTGPACYFSFPRDDLGHLFYSLAPNNYCSAQLMASCGLQHGVRPKKKEQERTGVAYISLVSKAM